MMRFLAVLLIVGCSVSVEVIPQPDMSPLQPGAECQHPAKDGDLCPSTECAQPPRQDMGEASYACCDSVNVAGVGRCCQFYSVRRDAGGFDCSRCSAGGWDCRSIP